MTAPPLFPAGKCDAPKEIVERLSDELRKIRMNDELKRQFAGLGFNVLATSPEQSAQRMREEIARCAGVIKESGLKMAE